METATLPDWLTSLPPTDDMLPRFPTTPDQRELERMTFLAIFERVVEGLAEGKRPSHIVKDDPRQVDFGKFMAWVRRDPERNTRFEEAKSSGMIVLEDKMLDRAEGIDSMEDVSRSKLVVDSIRFVLQSWDRKRYGDNKQIEQTITIDLREAHQRAEQLSHNRMKLIEGERVG